MTKLKDNLWLWGQDAGSHHACRANKNYWKLPGENKMGPVEGAKYLGINNMCRVVMGNKPEKPFDSESKKLIGMDQVVWSAVGDKSSLRNENDESDLEEVLRQAEKFTNITGAILDDFFVDPQHNDGKVARHSLENIRKIRDSLQNFPQRSLDLWVVWYQGQYDMNVDEYLKLFDVITCWFMDGNLEMLDESIEKIIQKTPGKRRLAGCYMWNYGQGKAFSIDEMKFQCDKYYSWILKGYIEGIIFCSNCCADLGLEAVEWTREWIKETGNKEIPGKL